jgi:hypothetical protein
MLAPLAIASASLASLIDFDRDGERGRAVEEVGELCALAQQQGMPSDPQAAGELHRRLPKYYVVPGATDQM